ncbi:hypothetical protein [Bradyrhizobium sp. SZCCHNR3118]|uniref:hypothetical protein n=1 Tax=Bradyrhizobium sp. SZCCHNR3118 TaxID=3057468 RepID=UPI0029164718|nr:hypothetical protein [Bradyrhizobium sp. SZCCHNR3118]
MLALQAATYEALAFLGPVWSAVCAGFAVMVWGEVYITPAGLAYLEALNGDRK